MTIADFLKLDTVARVEIGASWMFWEPLACEWVVLNRKYGTRKTILYRGASEEDAIAALRNEEVGND